MPGRAAAVQSGADLQAQVAALVGGLGLQVQEEVKVGRRIWGAERYIDVVASQPETRLSLGIECKYQGGAGSAEEKIPLTVQDIRAWPIRGIVVVAGDGFSDHMRSYLYSTGLAVDLDDLEQWLRLFFAIPA